RPPGFAPDVVDFSRRFVGLVTERFWGSFGWYTVRLPGPLTVAVTVMAVSIVALGVATVARRRSVVRPSTCVVLLSPAALLVALMAVRAWSLHARSGQYPFTQGRYLFAGVVGLVVVAAIGWHRLVPRRAWSMPLASAAVVGL